MARKLATRIVRRLDTSLKTDMLGKAAKLEATWHNSELLNVIRRNAGPAMVRWKYKLGVKDKGLLKLHLGCGDRHLAGYINIDWRKTRATDLVCDIRRLPYKDNSAELIETYHVIEHLPRHDLPRALTEWGRILTPEGKLIIECPDFDEIAEKYLEGDERQLDGIFGLQRFRGDTHLFGYSFQRLRRLLQESGFTNIERQDAKDNHASDWSCMRVECANGETK